MKFPHLLIERNSYSYDTYRDTIDDLHAEDKTTGENHSEDMLGYSRMNVTRMNRLDKTAKLNDTLVSKIKELPAQKWLVISEAWCGDAAQNLPWIKKMADLNPKIELEIILRDENQDIMDDFLTNGGRSIPKLISLNKDQTINFSWGPRPTELQDIYTQMRNDGLEYTEISKTIHTMYAKNKGQALQHEFEALLEV
jgi:hypothetical protein